MMTNNALNNLDPGKIRQICLRYERELSLAKDWMFWFLLVWTVVFLVIEWLDFFYGWAAPVAMEAGYTILLGAYIVHKEVGRWAGIHMKIRRGELFVYTWWTMFLVMFLVEYVSQGGPVVPDSMPAIAYKVLGYFIFTEVSKSFNTWMNERSSTKTGAEKK